MCSIDRPFWEALDILYAQSTIVIDRPKGSAHPRYPDFLYPLDYGYLDGTASGDGAGIDVWIGSADQKINAIICIVDLMKKDSEIKILIGCSDEEINLIHSIHNKTASMKGILIRRPE